MKRRGISFVKYLLACSIILCSFVFTSSSAQAAKVIYAEDVVAEAKKLVGVPYVWGGYSIEKHGGLDCTGLVYYVYHTKLGYDMTRAQSISKSELLKLGTKIEKAEDLQPGDIFQFNKAHVGIYIGNDKLIQAAGDGYMKVIEGPYWKGNFLYGVRLHNVKQGSSGENENPAQNEVKVTTTTVQNVTKTNALIRGYVTKTPSDILEESGFYLGKSPEFTNDDIVVKFPVSDSANNYQNGTGFNITCDMNNEAGMELEAGTTYYYQCFVVKKGETEPIKGSVQSFTTINIAVDAMSVSPEGVICYFDSQTGTLCQIADLNGTSIVTIPDKVGNKSVTAIGDNAFYNCDSLTSVIIPNSVKSIGNYAFANCINLEKIQIPQKCQKIGDYAFRNCDNLKIIEVPQENDYYCDIDGVLFTKDKTTLMRYPSGRTDASYTIPSGVTDILYAAFEGNVHLNHVDFPAGMKNIGSASFNKCINLKHIVLPEGTEYIGRSAFRGCKNLSSIVLPASMGSIKSWLVAECGKVILYFKGTEEQWINIRKEDEAIAKDVTVVYLAGTLVHITEVSRSENTVSTTLYCEKSGNMLWCASYNNNGKLLKVFSKNLNFGGNSVEFVLTEEVANVKFFVRDQSGAILYPSIL